MVPDDDLLIRLFPSRNATQNIVDWLIYLLVLNIFEVDLRRLVVTCPVFHIRDSLPIWTHILPVSFQCLYQMLGITPGDGYRWNLVQSRRILGLYPLLVTRSSCPARTQYIADYPRSHSHSSPL